jgi:hypothetical protein
MHSRISSKGCGVLLALTLAALPSYAHHGWSGNEDKQFELTGVLETPPRLSGAHATMQIRADGKLWDITLTPPVRTKRAGLEEGTIPVGATVTVSGHRNSNAERFEIKGERVTYNGKVFNVYPDRE